MLFPPAPFQPTFPFFYSSTSHLCCVLRSWDFSMNNISFCSSISKCVVALLVLQKSNLAHIHTCIIWQNSVLSSWPIFLSSLLFSQISSFPQPLPSLSIYLLCLSPILGKHCMYVWTCRTSNRQIDKISRLWETRGCKIIGKGEAREIRLQYKWF